MVQKTTVATNKMSSIMIIDYGVFIYIVSKSPILEETRKFFSDEM